MCSSFLFSLQITHANNRLIQLILLAFTPNCLLVRHLLLRGESVVWRKLLLGPYTGIKKYKFDIKLNWLFVCYTALSSYLSSRELSKVINLPLLWINPTNTIAHSIVIYNLPTQVLISNRTNSPARYLTYVNHFWQKATDRYSDKIRPEPIFGFYVTWVNDKRVLQSVVTPVLVALNRISMRRKNKRKFCSFSRCWLQGYSSCYLDAH